MTAPGNAHERHTVLCVDDNTEVAAALAVLVARTPDFEWRGWLPSAESLLEETARTRPALIILDVDMPGADPFRILETLSERFPESRVVMFSGHVRPELVDRALNAGAWGYVSKNDDEQELLDALRRVAAGEFALSSEALRLDT